MGKFNPWGWAEARIENRHKHRKKSFFKKNRATHKRLGIKWFVGNWGGEVLFWDRQDNIYCFCCLHNYRRLYAYLPAWVRSACPLHTSVTPTDINVNVQEYVSRRFNWSYCCLLICKTQEDCPRERIMTCAFCCMSTSLRTKAFSLDMKGKSPPLRLFSAIMLHLFCFEITCFIAEISLLQPSRVYYSIP